MKRIIAGLLLALALSPASAAPLPDSHPYFRALWNDPAHPIISAGVLFNPRSLADTQAVTDIAIFTHSTSDGSLCNKLNLGSWCVPEDWVPFEVGGGGNGNSAVLEAGTAFNVAPWLGSAIMYGVNNSSSANAQAVKAAFTSGYSGSTSPVSFALGIKPTAQVMTNGTFNSLPEMFPGQGFFDIFNKTLRYEAKLSYHF